MSPDPIAKAGISGSDFNRTGREDDAIKAKEAELLLKAKQLENEML